MQWTLIRNLSPYAGNHMEKIAFEISKQFHSQPPDNSRYVRESWTWWFVVKDLPP